MKKIIVLLAAVCLGMLVGCQKEADITGGEFKGGFEDLYYHSNEFDLDLEVKTLFNGTFEVTDSKVFKSNMKDNEAEAYVSESMREGFEAYCAKYSDDEHAYISPVFVVDDVMEYMNSIDKETGFKLTDLGVNYLSLVDESEELVYDAVINALLGDQE